MRVLHTLGWYFPESSGGTEVYVRALAKQLIPFGVHSNVAAPDGSGDTPHDTTIDDAPVHRYVVGPATRAEIAHDQPHRSFDAFCRWLDTHKPDIYHQHSWTRGCGLHHLRYAKSLGLRTVLTVHVPSVLCLRGTMMLDGETACDGHVDTGRCTRCWSASRGIPSRVSDWQVRHPDASVRLSTWLPPSRARTLLATPALVARRKESLRALSESADRVVAVCQWLHEALASNGVEPTLLRCVRQGADGMTAPIVSSRPGPEDPTLRVGFIGRWDPVKGIHVLVDAVRRLDRSVPIMVTVHALTGDRSYERHVRNAAAGDPRIVFAPALPREAVLQTLSGFDILAVPSQWLETGPLVVLESFAAGTPVIGSALGGISELVTDGVDGVLVPAADAQAWSAALMNLAHDRASALRAHVRNPRTTDAVARDMHAIYTDLLSR